MQWVCAATRKGSRTKNIFSKPNNWPKPVLYLEEITKTSLRSFLWRKARIYQERTLQSGFAVIQSQKRAQMSILELWRSQNSTWMELKWILAWSQWDMEVTRMKHQIFEITPLTKQHHQMTVINNLNASSWILLNWLGCFMNLFVCCNPSVEILITLVEPLFG